MLKCKHHEPFHHLYLPYCWMPVVFGQTTIKGKVFSKTDGGIAGATVIARFANPYVK